jgi:radical SAM superfamily enzyme YgiQ (UPF0313 family)|tara:strand:- start:729 stop:2264 length:1536 start_codon:yes stop_codon:yes gene_type:complete
MGKLHKKELEKNLEMNDSDFKKLDILLLNVPISNITYPPAATTLLKGVVVQHGFTALVQDLNFDLNQRLNDDDIFTDVSDYLCNISDSTPYLTMLNDILDDWVQDIVAQNPKFVGVSVFTFQCQHSTRLLLEKLRPLYSGKIIVGGAGISTNGINGSTDFGKTLLAEELIDFYVRGDGETAIIRILNNEDGPGINNTNFSQSRDLDQYANPDYSDVIDLPYAYEEDYKLLPINGSRGCVRACTFCDIHTFWDKFTFRSGESLAREMIDNWTLHGVQHFTFTDSLINGSMREFRALLKYLVAWYAENNLPEAFFRFSGQFIVRNERQQTQEDYKLMAKAGCQNMMIGVETGSDEVRAHMQKKFTNAELDFVIGQFSENNLNCFFSMISGYPTETKQNFDDTLDMFSRYQKYALDGTIIGLNLGATLSIDEGTALYDDMKEYGYLMLHDSDNSSRVGINWVNPQNLELTLEERIKRRIDLQEFVMDRGFVVWNGDTHLKRLMKSYERVQLGNY